MNYDILYDRMLEQYRLRRFKSSGVWHVLWGWQFLTFRRTWCFYVQMSRTSCPLKSKAVQFLQRSAVV